MGHCALGAVVERTASPWQIAIRGHLFSAKESVLSVPKESAMHSAAASSAASPARTATNADVAAQLTPSQNVSREISVQPQLPPARTESDIITPMQLAALIP